MRVAASRQVSPMEKDSLRAKLVGSSSFPKLISLSYSGAN